MVFLLIAAAVVGLVLGTQFRAPALLAASAVAAAAGVGMGLALKLEAGWTLLLAIACVIVLDIAYLVGLLGTTRRWRPGRRR